LSGVITVVHREFSARQAVGSFSPAAVLFLASRMPSENPCLWDRVTDLVWCCLRICLFARGAEEITVVHREFSARQAMAVSACPCRRPG